MNNLLIIPHGTVRAEIRIFRRASPCGTRFRPEKSRRARGRRRLREAVSGYSGALSEGGPVHEDENDARSKNVRALPPALEIHSQGKGLSEQFFDQVTGDFSTEERELLDQLLGRMLEKGKALAAAPAPEKEVRP